MLQTNADIFRATLQQMERSGDPGPLVAFFHDDATIDTPAHETKVVGHAAIHKFWSEYLASFSRVHSIFTVEQTIGDTSILQWVSEGALPTGRPIRYRGVTILTFRGYKVATMTAYYDSAAFLQPTAEATPSKPALTVAIGANNDEGGD